MPRLHVGVCTANTHGHTHTHTHTHTHVQWAKGGGVGWGKILRSILLSAQLSASSLNLHDARCWIKKAICDGDKTIKELVLSDVSTETEL